MLFRSDRVVLAELAGLAASGRIEVPISRTYPLAEVRAAFAHLEHDHPLGKVVLLPNVTPGSIKAGDARAAAG